MLTLLILAGVTVFLVFKLKNVLGTKTGHEKPPEPVFRSREPEQDAPRPAEVVEDTVEVDEDDPMAVAIAQMKAVEPDFSPD
ncbi:MAG: Tim44 domain-containing protein, partial [Pseudomonadota bacterium]